MYFSGFCLKNEELLFEPLLEFNDYTVAGFSYGAQKALEYALTCSTRIDKVILLSPAFFQSSSPSFIRTQERYFDTNRDKYMEQFYLNVSYPADPNIIINYKSMGTLEELKDLLTYVWDIEKIRILKSSGVDIEVYVGGMDKIIDTEKCIEFFLEICTMNVIKNAGHLLYIK